MKNTISNFQGGKTKQYYNKWQKLTSDKWILNTICGYSVELNTKPKQNFYPQPIKFSEIEDQNIEKELERFLNCGIIEKIPNRIEPEEFISNIFTRPKKDGKIRVILNLRQFNNHMEQIHFKMETLQTAINLMTRNCYFGSVDLSEAYYSIPIHENDKKYFRFYYKDEKFQFKVLVMGLATAPRVFTKILKPLFAKLRDQGCISTVYIDDSCLQGHTFEQCEENILNTVQLMDELGLTVNPKKSCFIPSKQIQFVGFILCSETMTVRLTKEKVSNIKELCYEIIGKKFITIRIFAKLIGMLVASEPGVRYAPLFYKPLEKIKENNLSWKRGHYDSFMKVTPEIRTHIQWWLDNLDNSFKPIEVEEPAIVMSTDSSLMGWGACIVSENKSTNGVWSIKEKEMHINILEIQACKMGLMSLCKSKYNMHIRILTDNTTTCSYINKFGGRKVELNAIARDMWLWSIARGVHLSAAHIPGCTNKEADRLSRVYNDDLEWSLDQMVFQKLETIFGKFDVDLFASRLNAKLESYVSRYLEPEAIAVDAFSFKWNYNLAYVFPPFSLIPKILQKIQFENCRVVLIAPVWKTQSWWPCLQHLLCQDWYQLPNTTRILRLVHKPEARHPLAHMKMGAFHISGIRSGNKEYKMIQLT